MTLFEDLYGKVRVEKKIAVGTKIRPTVIQNFAGEVSLYFSKDGKIVKQEYSSVKLAVEDCEMKPILFEKG